MLKKKSHGSVAFFLSTQFDGNPHHDQSDFGRGYGLNFEGGIVHVIRVIT